MCVNAFRTFIDVSKSKYQSVLQNTASGLGSIRTSIDFQRVGRAAWSGSTTQNFVVAWLQRLAHFHDPMPHRDYTRLYFPTKKYTFKKYQAELEDGNEYESMPTVSFDYFSKIWNKEIGGKIRVRGNGTQFAMCSLCETLKRERALCGADSEKRAINMAKQAAHDLRVDEDHKQLDVHIEMARIHPDELLFLQWDGADQQLYGLPYFRIPDKTSQSIYKMSQYIISCESFTRGIPCHLFHHIPIFPRDSNLSIEVLHRTLTKAFKLRKEKNKKLPRVLYIQLDNCWRENKNQYVLGFLGELVRRHIFEEVRVFFLCVGHTHCKCDQNFSVISKGLNNGDLYSPSAFLQAVRNSKHDKFNVETIWAVAAMKQHMKDEGVLRPISGQSDVQTFKICLCTQVGYLFDSQTLLLC